MVTKATLTVYPTATLGVAPFRLRATRLTERAPGNGEELNIRHAAVPDDIQPVTAGVPVTFDVTPTVRGWKESRFPNYGLALTTDPGQLDVPTLPAFPNFYRVTVASSSHPDNTKRPVLTVSTAQLGQAVSDVTLPKEGKLTSRFVDLQARTGSAHVESARFEYLAPKSEDWASIPVTALRVKDSGVQPSSTAIPVDSSSRHSQLLVWDLNKTPGAQSDGPVRVRAILGTVEPGGGYTPVVNFRLDRKNPDTTSTVEAGPGTVDLLTGDLTVTETDASVSAFLEDLKLTRTYHSRGGSPRNADMFGPGWISGLETDGGEMPYKGIYNFTEVQEQEEIVDWMVSETDAFWESFDWDTETFDFSTLGVNPVYDTVRYETNYLVLEANDGTKLTFRQEGSDWKPDDHHLDVRVDPLGSSFVVTDRDGAKTTFAADAPGSPQHRPISYAQLGSQSTTYQYTSIGGRKRLHRIVAPVPPGVSFPGPGWAAGYRALELVWSSVPAGSTTVDRVIAVQLRAIDPSGARAEDWINLATYEYDAAGRLKKATDPRGVSGSLPVEYAYDSDGRLTTYTPAGERPWTFAYQAIDGDEGTGRLRSVTRKAPAGEDATTTFVYDAPVSGSGAPFDLSHGAVDTWGQADLPWTATAVFPPDAVPTGSGMPSSWDRATIHYLGVHGSTVNVADAEGNISTAEYNDYGKLVRELTPRNRERALAASGSTKTRSFQLETRHTYAPNNIDLHRTLGPLREFRRPDGSTVLGRQRTLRWYDGDKPAGFDGDRHLLTETSTAIRREPSGGEAEGEILDLERTTHAYSAAGSNRGWEVGKPLATTVGSDGEAATTRFVYHPTLPLLTEKRLPKAAGSDSYALTYHYYGIGSPPSWCASGPGLANAAAAAGQLCGVEPSAAPSSGHPRVGVFTRYSLLWDPIEISEAPTAATAGAPLRLTTIQRDLLGRETLRVVTATSGRVIPSTFSFYSATTGRATTTTDTGGGSVARSWDDNGRLSSYTDADGGVTSYTYDLNGRVNVIQDPQGTRGLSYDDRDEVTAVVDSELSGPITAVRDADGQVVEQTLPGGLKASTAYAVTGEASSLTWERTAGCAGASCLLVSSEVERDAQGRIATHESSRAERAYAYDSVGRLQREDQARDGVCTRREFGFDKNSNRLSLDTRTSAPSGACGTGSVTSKTSGYDGADRITTSGYTYDALGRTLAVPAGDSPSGAATLTYDVDDLAATIVTDEYEQTVERDPMRRLRSDTTKTPRSGSGSTMTTATLRYGDDEDAPIGRTGSWGWERYIGDVDGDQVAVVNQGGDVTWQLTDLHGDVVATIEGGATALKGEREYDAFGALTSSTGSWTASVAPGLTRGWLGGYGKHTPVSPGGFVHMGARVYNPVSGRFLQVDPVEGGSANDYEYCVQDPVNCLDLDGRFAWVVPAVVAAVRAAPTVYRAGRSAVAGARKLTWRGGEITTKSAPRNVRVSPFGHGHFPKRPGAQRFFGRASPKAGPAARRPHYHRRPGIGKHRPWER